MNAAVPLTSRQGLLATFGRHQAGSIIATCIDFGTMSLLVSGLGMSAALATAIGAFLGGVSNFLLGRHWIFSAKHEHVGGQAGRYAFVSGASLGFNAGGEYVLHDLLGIQYLLARVIIATVVSVFWNFPVQRAFVYRQVGAHGHGSPSPGSTP
jgi:putative flippase GtrA